MSDIFISYATEDLDRIRSLAAALQAQGWSVFYDRTIPNGKTWRDVLGKSLRDSRCVVVAWSTVSIESTWVQEEADEGRERGILHPVFIDPVNAPLGFRAFQAANLVGWNARNPSPEFDRFLRDLEGTLGPPRPGTPQPPLAETPPQKEAQPSAREDNHSQRYILIGVGLLFAVGVLAAIFSQSQGPPPAPAPPIVKSDESSPKQNQETTPPSPPAPIEKPSPSTVKEPSTATPKVRTKPTKLQPIAGQAKNITGKDGAPMVLIPAGEFWMGSPDNEGQEDEHQRHRVYLDTYSMDKFEVPVSRYAEFLRSTGRQAPGFWDQVNTGQHSNLPVVGVDWHDAEAYCHWAGKRLPTEAEWEKGARGMDGRVYPWGNEQPTPRLANFGKMHNQGNLYDESLAPVESYEAGKSPYELHNMAGNAWEWTADWYDGHFYGQSPQRNPTGPPSGTDKIIRGGSWFHIAADLRSANRFGVTPTNRFDSIGFRCAQDRPN